MKTKSDIAAAIYASQRQARRRAILTVLPLVLFVTIVFLVPIGQMLLLSVHDDDFSSNMPRTTAWLSSTEPGTKPDEAAYQALVEDLREGRGTERVALAGARLNQEVAGGRSLMMSSARRAESLKPPYAVSLPEVRSEWSSDEVWAGLRNVSSAWTSTYFLAAVDRKLDFEGSIVSVPSERQIYIGMFLKTFAFAALITGICALLAYPVSLLLAVLPSSRSNVLMILVLLPLWTALLVRTTCWIVLLQEEGVVNDVLVSLGLIDDGNRFKMMYNQFGTVVAMVHVLLPFMILPIFSVMRPINPTYVRAARSLGASRFTAFRRVYFPQTLPGIAAGSILVFIMCLGYYVTPALVGGASGQLISNLIAYQMQSALNWSFAAALSILLLVCVGVVYWIYQRLSSSGVSPMQA